MQLRIENVSRALADHPVLAGVNVTLEEGRVGCLLGASGCGKTTLLRCIAGFDSIDAGSIHLNDEVVAADGTHVPPHARGVGMVFQDHALFPHLSVAGNTAFGLHYLSSVEASQRVDEVLDLVGLQAHADRFPHQLSGGQQQRAALARALAPNPRLLLLDEPFASLDRELRYRLVQEVSAILRASHTTALWVTHDAREALQAADRVGVMRKGRVVQWDTPSGLYTRPASPDVARALGDCALIAGVMDAEERAVTAMGAIAVSGQEALTTGQNVSVLIRPEQVKIVSTDNIISKGEAYEQSTGGVHAASTGHQKGVRAVIKDVWFHGSNTLCTVVLGDETEVKVMATPSTSIERGATVTIAYDAPFTAAFPA